MKEKRNTKVRLVPSGFDDQAFLFSTKSRHLSNTAVKSNASAELMKSFKTCYNVALLHGHEKCIFETPHNEIKCVLGIKESNFNGNWVKIFTVRLTVRGGGANQLPPPRPQTNFDCFFY